MRNHAAEEPLVPQHSPAHNGTVPPKRQPYSARRPREYLTPAEVEHLMHTAQRRGRYGHRDATMILVAYRHGLRVACGLRSGATMRGTTHAGGIGPGLPHGSDVHRRALRQLVREGACSSASKLD